MRKLVLSISVLLVLVGAGLFGWKLWKDLERQSRHAEWREQLKEESKRDYVLAAVREELKEDPECADARAVLGEALAFTGKFSDAAVELRAAARLDPENVRARVTLADVCIRLDLIDEAVKALKEALPRANEEEAPAIALRLGHIITERYRGSAKDEDFRAARNYFQDARRHASTEAEAMDGYAGLWLTKGPDQDYEKGVAAYRELLEKHPDYPRAGKIRELLDIFDKKNAETPAPDPNAPSKDGDAEKRGDG